MAFTIDRTYEVPSEVVWRLITDTRKWPLWGPSVVSVDCHPAIIASDSKGRIQTPFGTWLPFAVTTFVPGSYWKWKVAGITATGHRVVSLGENRCRLSFTIPMWAMAYGLVCRWALMRIDRLLKQRRATDT